MPRIERTGRSGAFRQFRTGRAGFVVCLAGKRPRPGTIFHDVIDRLANAGVSVSLEVPDQKETSEEGDWPAGSLIVHRGVSRTVLEQLAAAERQGWSLCNSAVASLLVLDRHSLNMRLAEQGLPVSASVLILDWTACKAEAAIRDCVIKSADGAMGRGGSVLFAGTDRIPDAPPFPGPYLLEDRIRHDAMDRKLYVAGENVFGLLKPWPRTEGPFDAFDPPEDLRRLALAVGRASGLEIYGVDVVIGPDGSCVVDVNVFPGFRGVAGATEAVARHIMRRSGAMG